MHNFLQICNEILNLWILMFNILTQIWCAILFCTMCTILILYGEKMPHSKLRKDVYILRVSKIWNVYKTTKPTVAKLLPRHWSHRRKPTTDGEGGRGDPLMLRALPLYKSPLSPNAVGPRKLLYLLKAKLHFDVSTSFKKYENTKENISL